MYKIIKWQAVIREEKNGPMSPNPIPVIYLEYDQNLMDYINQNGGVIDIKVIGSNSIYDNHLMVSTLNYMDDKIIVLNLNSYFYEYPKQNGTIYIPLQSSTKQIFTIPSPVRSNITILVGFTIIAIVIYSILRTKL